MGPAPRRDRGARAVACAAALVVAAALPACARPGRPEGTPGAAPATHLENLGRVDEGVWRSAQPSAQGFAEAERLGVRTVVDLRAHHGDERRLEGTGIAQVRVPMQPWRVVEDAVARALRAMTDPSLRPVLVHCAHGQDRTGVVVAAYRVVVQGWSREAAVEEMRAYGNHPLWGNLRAWVRGFDVERMRARVAGLPAPEADAPR